MNTTFRGRAYAGISAALFSTTLMSPSLSVAATTHRDSIEVRSAIDRGNAGYIEAWKKRDADAFAALFAQDGAMLPARGGLVMGRARIKDRMAQVMKKVGMREGVITTRRVFIIGDLAYETGSWKFTFVDTSGTAEPDSGQYVEVWRRVGKREWKMYRDIGVPKD